MSNNDFKQAIKSYLDKRAKTDKLFAVVYAKANKNLTECCSYIMGEPISYESTSYDIYEKKDKWEQRMNKAIALWKNSPK